ncbi:hypothetical protein HG536_0H04000 [Torulaspora globosa]|uniref:WH1 domain-containing protein n=1 Tax=Torulaspora globosa TaxID=48254 RepID=A0A7G3ZND8_9SACH|nr:uncharacterized protein HG536_0H04000 [Torulaspora globosa]QLL35024.1 hypothetical protein HG536_0H04000 [Torulaspora globosa]
MGLLSSTDKELIKRALPKSSNKIIDVAIARLYVAYPDPNEWQYTGLSGVIVLVDDLVGHTFFLKLVDIKGHRGVLWDHELYAKFEYYQDRTFFHTFEIEDCYAGLLFEDLNEASHFLKRIQKREKYASKKTLSNKNAIALTKKVNQERASQVVNGPRGESLYGQQRERYDYEKAESIPQTKHKAPPPPPPVAASSTAGSSDFEDDGESRSDWTVSAPTTPAPAAPAPEIPAAPVPQARMKHPVPPLPASVAPPAPSDTSLPGSGPTAPAPAPQSPTLPRRDNNPFPIPTSTNVPNPFPVPLPNTAPQQANNPFPFPVPQQSAQNNSFSAPARPVPAPPARNNRPVPVPPRKTTRNAPPVPASRHGPPPPLPPHRNVTPQAATQNMVPTHQTGRPPAPPPPRRGPAPPPPPRANASQAFPQHSTVPPVQTSFPSQNGYQSPPPPPTPPTTFNSIPPAAQASSAVHATSAPPPPPPPPMAPAQTTSAPPPPPPSFLTQPQNASALPPPPLPPVTTPASNGGFAETTGDVGRDALLASIRGAGGIGSLRKVDKSQLDRPSVLLQEAQGKPVAPNSPSGPPPSGGGSLADALAAALSQRKAKVGSGDYDNGDDW